MTDGITYHVLASSNAWLLDGSDVFDHAIDPDQMAAFLADAGHEMVFATDASGVVGFASGAALLHPDKRPAFFINELGVREEMRLRGIGTALIVMLTRVARERGCEGIWLATETDNAAARALYRRLGARETEAVVVYAWDGATDY